MVKAVVTELVLVQDHELTEEEKDELSFFEQVRQRKRQQEQQPQPLEVAKAVPPAAAPPASATAVASAPPVAQPVPRAVAQPLTKMMVVIPPGISAGMTLRIQTPHGLMEITVPFGVGAGMPLEGACVYSCAGHPCGRRVCSSTYTGLPDQKCWARLAPSAHSLGAAASPEHGCPSAHVPRHRHRANRSQRRPATPRADSCRPDGGHRPTWPPPGPDIPNQLSRGGIALHATTCMPGPSRTLPNPHVQPSPSPYRYRVPRHHRQCTRRSSTHPNRRRFPCSHLCTQGSRRLEVGYSLEVGDSRRCRSWGRP